MMKKFSSQDGYHNVFGYMEEIYDAHVKFWSWTLEPCLEMVRDFLSLHVTSSAISTCVQAAGQLWMFY